MLAWQSKYSFLENLKRQPIYEAIKITAVSILLPNYYNGSLLRWKKCLLPGFWISGLCKMHDFKLRLFYSVNALLASWKQNAAKLAAGVLFWKCLQ